MLVHALCLRHRGVKIPTAELRLHTPLLGQLAFRRSPYDNRDDRGYMWCLLTPRRGDAADAIQLYDAQVLRIEPRGILVGGFEEEWNRKQCTKHRQVLWAWPVSGENVKPAPQGANIDSMKFVEALAALV